MEFHIHHHGSICVDSAVNAQLKQIFDELGRIQATLSEVRRTQEQIMATLDDIKASETAQGTALTQLTAAVQAAVTAIQADVQKIADLGTQITQLQQQLANGTPVTSADLDSIKISFDTNTQSVLATVTALTNAVNPPAQ